MSAETAVPRRPVRWHIAVFLAPAVLVYTALMIFPLANTLGLSAFNTDGDNGLKFVGFIFATVTMGVMLTTAMLVKGYADGGYTPESTTFARR